jgi:hypothetical protein
LLAPPRTSCPKINLVFPDSPDCYAELVRPEKYIGRPLENLSLADRWKLSGKWVALEIYTPDTTPIRTIQALGDSAKDCVDQLSQRGLNPTAYEFFPLSQPYQP